MQIIYVQLGWEGPTTDSRILQDALSREDNLRVSRGCYYLVDAGYANSLSLVVQLYHTCNKCCIFYWGPFTS